MTEASDQFSLRSRIATPIYFSSLYFITVGVLYLWGYWSRFNINILSYLGVSDIIKTTALPIAVTLMALLVGAVAGEAFFGPNPTRPSRLNPQLAAWVAGAWKYIVPISAFMIVAILIYPDERKWMLLAMFVAWPATSFAKSHGFLANEIANDSARMILIFVLTALPMVSFGQGRINAGQILDGKRFHFLRADRTGTNTPLSCAVMECPRLIGNAGEVYFFLIPKTQEIAISKLESIGHIILNHYIASETQDKNEREP